MSAADLLAAALAGERRALARLLTRVEAGGEEAGGILCQLYPQSGTAHLIGVTGAPGTGKSTLVGQLARTLRRRGQRVAIVAVDPTSPFSGGALLGDRVRLAALSGDPGVFVRSMATRGAAGGLAEQTAAVTVVLAAAGFDAVLIETVGVGQDELEIAGEAQTTLVVTAPGLGDDVQALKAGILEIADVIVVNKADREGADRLAADLTFAIGPGRQPRGQARGRQSAAGGSSRDAGGWTPPVIRTVATSGAGAEELVAAALDHRAWLERSGAGAQRARALAERHILRWAAAKALRRAEQLARDSGQLQRLVEQVAARRLAPAAAADELLRVRP